MAGGSKKDERAKGIVDIIEKGENVANVIDKALSFATAVIKFMDNQAEGENKKKVAEKAARWRSESPHEEATLETQLESSKKEKQQFLSDLALKTAKFALENGGKLGGSSGLSQLSQSIITGFNPFLGSIVCAGVIAFDGYLTRKTIRDESLRTRDAIRQLQTSMERGFSELSSTFSAGFSELIWRLDEERELWKHIHEVLERPLETQVRELRKLAIEAYNFGWFKEALGYFERAEAQIATDYIIYHYMGNIHLFVEAHRTTNSPPIVSGKLLNTLNPEPNYPLPFPFLP